MRSFLRQESEKELHSDAVVFFCSAVEQPDVVFSLEQTRCGRADPRLAPEDCGTSDACDFDPESHSSSAGLDPGGSAELFFKLKENPEELLQLAPEAGDAVVPLTGETEGTLQYLLKALKKKKVLA